MPAYNPSQLHELVQNLIEDNNNNLIDPADVRQVLDAIIDSVYNLVATPNPEAPKLENVLLEGNVSGPKDIVMSTGRYVVFKGSGSNSVRVRPLQGSGGSPDAEVNLPLKPGTLALLEDIGRSAWLQPVLGQRDQQAGTEVAGDRWVVGPGASGDFAGHAGDIVERTNDGWVFTATQNGDMVRCLSDGAGVIRTKIGGVWVMPETMADVLSLSLVLGIGNMTGGHDIEVSATDAVAFRNNGHLMRLVGQDIAEDHTVIMPDAGGTLATVQQVAQLLFGIDLHAVLVNGTETNGRSITVSEGDGINYRAGTKQVRVKAPTTLTADRNVQWPDKSGTVATTDDVAAVAALVDGTMRAPEAYTPAGGLYPATYGGGAIRKGDTFRLGGGTMGGVTVDPEDLLVALMDAPGQSDTNWQVLESNRVVATQAEAEDDASTDTTKLMPPKRWWQAWNKGLSLAAFGNAVRGMLLTGYAVGANAAVAASDSIIGAVGKLQGQANATNTAVAGKLAKASNLGDLDNAGLARDNLGLGLLAAEDYADALVSRVLSDAMIDALGVWRVVSMQGNGKVDVADGASISQRVGMVRQVEGTTVRVQYAGVIEGVSGVIPGATYYLDPTTPGAITPIRPAAGAVVVGDGWGEGKLNLAPQPPVSTGSSTLASDVYTIDASGYDTGLRVYLVPGATYEVSVYAQVLSEVEAGRCLLRLECDGLARGRLSYSTNSGDPDVMVDLLVADLSAFDGSAARGAEEEELECSMSALVKTDEHSNGMCKLFMAPQNSGKMVHLRAGSTMTYKRIG